MIINQNLWIPNENLILFNAFPGPKTFPSNLPHASPESHKNAQNITN